MSPEPLSNAERELVDRWLALDHYVGWLDEAPNLAFLSRGTRAERHVIASMGMALDYKNPLWRDDEYGRLSIWQDIVAPPFFERYFCSMPPFNILEVPPEVGFASYFWHGVEWNFMIPVRVGDEFRVFVEKPRLQVLEIDRGAGRCLLETATVQRHVNQNGDTASSLVRKQLVTITAERRTGLMNAEADVVQHPSYPYSAEELAALDRLYDSESLRGAVPRVLDDVFLGEALQPVVHGPITPWYEINTFSCIESAARLPPREIARRSPGRPTIIVDPVTNVSHFAAEWHINPRVAQLVGQGAPSATLLQLERIYGRLLTNWCGDAGRILTLDIRNQADVKLGDALVGFGEVTATQLRETDCVVSVELWLASQRGEIAGLGFATVSLPKGSAATNRQQIARGFVQYRPGQEVQVAELSQVPCGPLAILAGARAKFIAVIQFQAEQTPFVKIELLEEHQGLPAGRQVAVRMNWITPL